MEAPYPSSAFDHWLQALSSRARHVLALTAGALTPLSLAPVNLWLMAIVSPTLLALLLYKRSARHSLQLSISFGLGLFGVGASWVYVSIHDFGYAPVWLAALLTALFAAGLALIFALPFYVLGKLKPSSNGQYTLTFAALWVLGEWSRSWLLTGFPWLFSGYSQLQTPLAGWAPTGGVFTVSLVTLLSAASLTYCLTEVQRRRQLLALTLASTLWLGGLGLQQLSWTQPSGDDKQVALIQANIPQEKKWQPSFLQPTLERYQKLSADSWDSDWIIWPEAALPLLYHRALPFLEEMHKQASRTNTALITGILYDDVRDGRPVYYNSVIGLGRATGVTHKTRLVPFGEYVPLEKWLRGLIQFFDLPASMITPGHPEQFGLQVGSERLAAAICYEIVYPDLVAASARHSSVILTISNDAWFGRSWGPLQHLQMAQMRALETGRYVIRGTNNGVSAIIGPDGKLRQSSQQFVQQVLRGKITPMQGQTPFMMTGSTPVIGLCFLLLVLEALPMTKYNPKHNPKHSRR